MSKKFKSEKITLDGKKAFVNSSGKMGRHMDIVRKGCGAHESKKRKMNNRKSKYGQRLKNSLKGYLGR